MLAFSGFNGFGQFGCEHGTRANYFKRISIDERLAETSSSSSFLVSCTWSYTAYAAGRNVLFKGFIKGQPNGDLCVSTCDSVKQIATCDRLCLLLLENGQLFKIDPKTENHLQEVHCTKSESVRKRNIFGEMKSPEGIKFAIIAIGSNITAAIDNTNTVFSIPSQIYQFPKHVRVRQLVCGFEHALLLTANGDIYGWGNGLRGQLGVEPLQMAETPVLIEALAGIKVNYIAAGGWHSAAISAFGDIYAWGFNSNGQLGLRVFKSTGLKEPSVYPLPQLLDLPECCESNANEFENCTPLKVFAGARHTILQMSCGSVLVTGWNKHGQLGLPENKEKQQYDVYKKITIENDFAKDFTFVCGPWCTLLMT